NSRSRYPKSKRGHFSPGRKRRRKPMRNVTRNFPARPLTPDERALVADWLATAGDIASAYVSERRSDDPDLHHRILISAGPPRGTLAYHLCGFGKGHLGCLEVWPENEDSTLSLTASRVEFHPTSHCGRRPARAREVRPIRTAGYVLVCYAYVAR